MNPDLNKSTALMLRIGIVAGMILLVAGLVLEAVDGSEWLLYIGILVLIVSPFLGVVVSFAVLIIEKDWKWAGIAAVLFVVTAIGIVISLN